MSIPIPVTSVPLKAGLLAALVATAAAVRAEEAAAAGAAPEAPRSAMAAEDTSVDAFAPLLSAPAAAASPAFPPSAASASATVKSDRAAGIPLAAQGTVSTLPALEVRGHRPAPGKTQDATALKLGMSLRETPRSLTVMNAERIKEQNFTTAASTFNYTPGVFANSYGQGGYHYYSRGQRMAAVDNRVDGFSGIAAGGDFSPGLFGIEKTVMLRGPAGLLYGASGAPGGMINLITKKPQATRSTEINMSMGPYGGSDVGFNDGSSYSAEIDATGPLADDNRVLYRAQGRFENERHFTADVMDRNRYLNLAFTYALDGEGRYLLTPMFQTTRHHRPAGRGMVISPSSAAAYRGTSSAINFDDISSLDVNLSAGRRIDESFMAGGDFFAKPVDAVSVNAAYRYFTYDTDMNQYNPTGSPVRSGDTWTIQRAQTKSITERFNHGFDVNAAYDHKPSAGSWKTLTQLGFNARITGNDRTASLPGRPQSPIDISTGAAPALRDSVAALAEQPNTTSYQWNTYLQNQTSFLGGMFVLTTGLGYMQEHLDRDYSRTKAAKPADLGDQLATRYGRPTPNVALLYNMNPALGFYGSYSTSYTLPGGEVIDKNGESGNFDPVQGVNYEVGAKYDIPSLAASFNAALFVTETRNALVKTTDPADQINGVNWSYQVDGEGRQARGLEFSGELSPLPNWRVSGGGAYMDVEIQNSEDAAADGGKGDKVPEWSFNGFTRYDVSDGSLKGLGASLGIIYQGDRLSALKTKDLPNPMMMPWFTRVDAGLFYRVNNKLDFALNVENLANDERIVYGATSASGILEMGSPRRATFRTTYRM